MERNPLRDGFTFLRCHLTPSSAFPKELLMTAYIKDDNYTIVLVNNSTSKAFETKLEIEGKAFILPVMVTTLNLGTVMERNPLRDGFTFLRCHLK